MMDVALAPPPLASQTAPARAALITLSHLAKTFGRHVAVTDVDLDLAEGECIGLVGHNGAGKSTLIKLMLGLFRPTSGSVRVLGADPAGNAAAPSRGALGYLPENVAFQPSMTGIETLSFYARLKRQSARAVPELLGRVGLAASGRRRVGTYSKGMCQRLGLAQALLGDPRALLLDEPTSGLDPAARQDLYAIMRGLRNDGACVLISSHALAELEGQADRVVVMSRGRKVADGTLATLRQLAGIRPLLRMRMDGTDRDCARSTPIAHRNADDVADREKRAAQCHGRHNQDGEGTPGCRIGVAAKPQRETCRTEANDRGECQNGEMSRKSGCWRSRHGS
jgi:Cu-processing system ATP-binding protein